MSHHAPLCGRLANPAHAHGSRVGPLAHAQCARVAAPARWRPFSWCGAPVHRARLPGTAMSAEQVSSLCEQLVKAVTVIMDPASTQRYRLEALKVAGVRGCGRAGRGTDTRATAALRPLRTQWRGRTATLSRAPTRMGFWPRPHLACALAPPHFLAPPIPCLGSGPAPTWPWFCFPPCFSGPNPSLPLS